MGLLDSFRSLIGKEGAPGDRVRVAANPKKLDFEARFERLRSSVSGTMGNFFVARDRQSKRIVGVKICDPEKVQYFEARFQGLKKPSEGEIAMRMHHPCVVETLEFGTTTKGERYLVMEFVEGPGLQQVIQKADEQLVAGKRLTLLRQMAEGLAYVHSQGFIHRDICPRNYICLPELDGLKLIDFGLTVPATPPFMAPGNRTGTPLFMSPEIVRRKATDKRVDIFSFGVSAYRLCTFEFPWPVAETNGRAALQHDTHPPIDIFRRKPDLHPALGRAIMQCLQPDAAERAPSMDVFLRQIAAVPNERAE